MSTTWRWMLALPLLAVAAQTPSGEQEMRLRAIPYSPKPATTIRTETNLVDIGVVVRDRGGHPLNGLTKPDFVVRDEGRDREIATFSVEKFMSPAPAAKSAAGSGPGTPAPSPIAAAQPRWVGMVFDDLTTPAENLINAKAAAKRFLKDGLAANDRVGVFTTSNGLVLPFTQDAAKIAAAIDAIKFRDHQVRSSSCPLLTEYDSYRIANGDAEATGYKALEYNNCANVCPPGGGNRRRAGPSPTACDEATNYVVGLAKTLWEQVRMNSQDAYQALEDIVTYIAHLQGKRVMLLASSGFVSGTLEVEEDRVTEKALRANVVINALDAKGLYTADFEAGRGATGRSIARQQMSALDGKAELNNVMTDLADATGGLFFHNNNDLDLGFHELGMEPEVSYLLGIAPDALDGKYHRLKVTLADGRHATVQARKGYVAVAPKAEETPSSQRRLDSEVFTTTALADAPVTVTARSDKSPEGHQMAVLTFHVDIARAQFQQHEGTRDQKYRMVAALFHADGSYVGGIEGELDFALKDASYQKVLKGGLNADLHIEIPVGAYRLRTVVVEGDDNGRYSTATQAVEFK